MNRKKEDLPIDIGKRIKTTAGPMAEYNEDEFETPLEQKVSYNTHVKPSLGQGPIKRAITPNKTPDPNKLTIAKDENKSIRSKHSNRSKLSKHSRSKHNKEHRAKVEVDDFGLPISSRHDKEKDKDRS